MTEIKVMSIQDLLRIPNLKNISCSIVFITTKPNYYDFGDTDFCLLNIADTNAPAISIQNYADMRRVLYYAKATKIIYVCCDAGLSRSPAVAHFLAVKLHEFEQAKEIEKRYRFLNQALYKKLMEVI